MFQLHNELISLNIHIFIFSSICLWCTRLKFSIRKKQAQLSNKKEINIYFSPSKKPRLQKLIRTKRYNKQKVRRANIKISQLQIDLNAVQNQMNEISNNILSTVINNSDIPKCQSTLLHEIFEAARFKNKKNRRYSDSWMILCLLFQIR